jgi:uncharacterized protein YndB with AHSA1/START domain
VVDDGRCSLRLTRRYDATPDEVWDALTEPESLARWLAQPRDVELAPGGSFLLEFRDGGSIGGRIREVEPGRVLELDWTSAGEDTSVVRFELAAEGRGTVLVLDHRKIEAPVGMAYIRRWTGALERFAVEVGR